MKPNWKRGVRLGFLTLFLLGAAAGLVGCADEYVGYPGYRGGYYASYSGYRPYYGYGYAPYRSYGPYYGSPYYGSYYGAPYYAGPYYGGGTVVVSNSRDYRTYRGDYHTYRGGYHRQYRRAETTRSRQVTRRVTKKQTAVRRYENDDERRYYGPR
jgi:hypothetical protein